jgi:hypothetical protein
MSFSEVLNSRREACKMLVSELGKNFKYVTVLGSDVKSTAIRVNRNTSDIGEGGAAECGFVYVRRKLLGGHLLSLDAHCDNMRARGTFCRDTLCLEAERAVDIALRGSISFHRVFFAYKFPRKN